MKIKPFASLIENGKKAAHTRIHLRKDHNYYAILDK